MSETNNTGLHLSDTCTITISGPGKPVTAELPTDEAKALAELGELLAGAPRRPGGDLPQAEIELRTKRHDEALQGGRSFLSQLGAFTELDDREITLVLQYVRLLHFGDKGISTQDNWILETINGLLYKCIFDGIGGALADGPGDALHCLAHSYWGFRVAIDQARAATQEYKPLFEDPAANAEMAKTLSALDATLESARDLQKTIHRAVVAKKRSARKSRATRSGVR